MERLLLEGKGHAIRAIDSHSLLAKVLGVGLGVQPPLRCDLGSRWKG